MARILALPDDVQQMIWKLVDADRRQHMSAVTIQRAFRKTIVPCRCGFAPRSNTYCSMCDEFVCRKCLAGDWCPDPTCSCHGGVCIICLIRLSFAEDLALCRVCDAEIPDDVLGTE